MKLLLKHSCCILTSLCAMNPSNLHAADKAPGNDIVDTAVAAGDFTILAKALQAADLVDALKGIGPFTVFAPNDAAFKRLPKGTLENLLKPENKDQLVKILTYHVVSGKVDGSTAVTLKEGETLNGEKISIRFKNAALYINESRVMATDIASSNGVIHVIDNVLIPKNLTPEKVAVELPKGKQAVSMKIIEDAIDVGVDTFNSGNEKACAKIYQIAILAVLEIKAEQLDPELIENAEKTLKEVSVTKNASDNAWALRRILDATYQKLAK